MNLIKPELNRAYTFGLYDNLIFIGIARSLTQEKVFIFRQENNDTWTMLTKDEWYSEDIQKQLRETFQ